MKDIVFIIDKEIPLKKKKKNVTVHFCNDSRASKIFETISNECLNLSMQKDMLQIYHIP